MAARKKHRPAADTVARADRVSEVVEHAEPVKAIVEPAVATEARLEASPATAPAMTVGRRASVLLDAIAWPFEVAIVVCLLPFGRRSGTR